MSMFHEEETIIYSEDQLNELSTTDLCCVGYTPFSIENRNQRAVYHPTTKLNAQNIYKERIALEKSLSELISQ